MHEGPGAGTLRLLLSNHPIAQFSVAPLPCSTTSKQVEGWSRAGLRGMLLHAAGACGGAWGQAGACGSRAALQANPSSASSSPCCQQCRHLPRLTSTPVSCSAVHQGLLGGGYRVESGGPLGRPQCEGTAEAEAGPAVTTASPSLSPGVAFCAGTAPPGAPAAAAPFSRAPADVLVPSACPLLFHLLIIC